MSVTVGGGPTALAEAMRAFFTAQSVTANVVVGRIARSQQINQGAGGANRVVIDWGDSAGSLGKIDRMLRNPGGNPRPIWAWDEALTLWVWACDTAHRSDEEKQIAAVRELFARTLQAVQWAARADAVSIASVKDSGAGEMKFGREIALGLVYRVAILDVPSDVVTRAVPALTQDLEA